MVYVIVHIVFSQNILQKSYSVIVSSMVCAFGPGGSTCDFVVNIIAFIRHQVCFLGAERVN